MSFWKSIFQNRADEDIRKLIDEITNLNDEQRRSLHARAMSGEAEAAFLLGNAALNRPRTPENLKIAFTWFDRAARGGHPEGMFEIGVMYRRSEGVPRDDRKAIDYWKQAAEKGSAQAQYNLGGLYLRGELVSLDIQEGLRWTLRAAEQGLGHAQYRMYMLLRQADSTSPSESASLLKRAIEWLIAATKSHHPEACLVAGLLQLMNHLGGQASDDSRIRDGIRNLGQAAMSGQSSATILLREITNTDIGILENPVTVYLLQLLSIREGFLTDVAATRTWEKMSKAERDRAHALTIEMGLRDIASGTETAKQSDRTSTLSIAFGPPIESGSAEAIIDNAIKAAKSGNSEKWDQLSEMFRETVISRLIADSPSNPLLQLLAAAYGEIDDFHADGGDFIVDGVFYPTVNIDLARTRLKSGESLEQRLHSAEAVESLLTVLAARLRVRWCKVSILSMTKKPS